MNTSHQIITDPNKSLLRSALGLLRESDSKIFTCTYVSHWSNIKAEDGEADSVKWLGDHRFVGIEETYCVIAESNGT